MNLRRNILIFHLGALGDFILTWPLALALGRLHPQSRIIYVTHGQKGALAERLLRVESHDIEHGWHHLYGEASQLPPGAARLLAGSHSIYSFIASRGDVWSSQVARLSPGADICCLEANPPHSFTAHTTDHLLAQLAANKAVAEAVRQMIRSLCDRGLAQAKPAARTVVIHPGSGSVQKCWPADRFLELAHRFVDGGRPVRILLGETELERWSSQQVEAFAEIGEVRRPSTYLALHEALADAAAFVGNDSGPGHLAGVLGIPTFSLFGPTDPAVWKPLGPRVHVLHRQPMESILVDEVHEWVLRQIG